MWWWTNRDEGTLFWLWKFFKLSFIWCSLYLLPCKSTISFSGGLFPNYIWSIFWSVLRRAFSALIFSICFKQSTWTLTSFFSSGEIRLLLKETLIFLASMKYMFSSLYCILLFKRRSLLLAMLESFNILNFNLHIKHSSRLLLYGTKFW